MSKTSFTSANTQPKRRIGLALALSLLATPILALSPAHAESINDTREPVVSETYGLGPLGSAADSLGDLAPKTTWPTPKSRSLAATATLSTPQLRAAMADSLTRTASRSQYLGKAFSGVVLEPDGTPSWSQRSLQARLPASTQKLLTSYVVLASLPTERVLTTRVVRDAVHEERIVLVGAGDPTLSRARINALAAQTAQSLLTGKRRRYTLVLDTSYLSRDGIAAGWKSSYLLQDAQLVQGLPLAGFRSNQDAATAVGVLFARALAGQGITVTNTIRGRAAKKSASLASSNSAPVATLVARMLNRSDNDLAEFLLRHAARASVGKTTRLASLSHARAVLGRAAIPRAGLVIADGSGLSRRNRMPVLTLAAVIRAFQTNQSMSQVVFAWGATPRAGQTGTLSGRFHNAAHRCAVGAVVAKTGTLTDVVALAGVANSLDGKQRAFVFMENGLTGKNSAIRSAQDTLATTVVGCRMP